MTHFATRTQLEAFLTERLAGHALACELDWEDPELRYEIAVLWPLEHAAAYPATTVAHLVLYGAAHYEANDFWSASGMSAAEQRRAGLAFEGALAALGLETFPQFSTPAEAARRFVSVILAHGGIPAHLAGRFLRDALLPALRRGEADSAAELLARWRSDPPTYFPQAVRRFLVYGGRAALDLLDRLIALTGVSRATIAEHPGAQGLPAALVTAFLAIPEAEVARAASWPRPVVELDPYGAGGPTLRLPPLGDDLAREAGEMHWEVSDGTGTVRRVRASARRDPEPVPLAPAELWRVVASAGVRTREFTFEGLTRAWPVLAFDEHWRLVSLASGIRADALYVLAPSSLSLASVEAGGLRGLTGELTGSPGGAWAGNAVREYRLAGVDVLAVLTSDREIARLEVVRPDAGVELLGTALRDAAGELGDPVYAQPPALSLPPGAWTVRLVGPAGLLEADLSAADARRTLALGEIAMRRVGTPAGAEADGPSPDALDATSGGLDVGRYELTVQGTRLGSDLRTAFVMVPGLQVAVPDDPVSPTVGEVRVRVEADPGVRLFRQEPPVEVVVEADETRAALAAAGGDRRHRAALFVSVPRLRWAFRAADGVQPSPSTDALPLDDAERLAAGSVVISTGRAGLLCSLALEGPGDATIVVLGPTAADARGQAILALAGMRDALRTHPDGELRLVLRGGAVLAEVSHRRGRAPGPAVIVPDGPPVPHLGSNVRVRVVERRAYELRVDVNGYPGIITAERLPSPPATYAAGDRIEATVIRIEEGRVRLDACPYDPSRARIGGPIHGVVARIGGNRLVLDLEGMTGFLYPERLPRERPLGAWRVGERVEGRIIDVHQERRAVDVAILPFDADAWLPGSPVAGRVVRETPGGLVASVWRTSGAGGDSGPASADGHYAAAFVPRVLEADGPRLIEGSPLVAVIDRRDQQHERLALTCRPFNEAGLAVGQRVSCVVTMPLPRIVLVDVEGLGTTHGPTHAAIPRRALPAHLDVPGGPPIGTHLQAVVTVLDPAARRITLSARAATDSWSFGAPDEPSPFSVLRGRVER